MDYKIYTIFNMNVFRLAGDMLHVLAMLLLLFKIIKTKSSKGVSGRTQILFATVFLTRYLDVFTTYFNAYNTTMKIIYITCTLTTVYLIYFRYRDSYDKVNDTYRYEFLVIAAFILALLFNYDFEWQEIAWTFSIYLEALAIIPQLSLTRKRGCSRHIALYLVALGLYRMFYILNWIFRYVTEKRYDEIAFCAGCIQSFILLTFICWGSNNYHQLEKIDEENGFESKKPSPLEFTLDESNRNMLFNYIRQKHLRKESTDSGGADSMPVKVHVKNNATSIAESN